MFKKSLYIPSTIKFMKNKNYFVFLDNANNAHIISVNIPQNVYIRKTKSLLLISFETSHNKKLLSWFIFLKNLFKGLSNPFFVRLILRGVGFKSLSTIDAIELKLGYSHSCFFKPKPLVSLSTSRNIIIDLKSPIKSYLGTQAATLQNYRMPDVYKNKGVLYKGEKLRLKTGKKA